MKIDNLQEFVKLRRQLTEEKNSIQSRLEQINQALGEASASSEPFLKKSGELLATPARRGRKPNGGQSLREHVIAVLQDGPKSKEDVLSAVKSRGYKFSTNDPLNSLGVILYGKNPKFNRVDGMFSLGNAAASGKRQTGKRRMSPAGRKAIRDAARKRWAVAKASGKTRL